MGNNLIIEKKLENLLQSNWAEFIDKAQIMRRTMEFARDTEYRVLHQDEAPPQKFELSVTKVGVKESGLELWIEFTVPKDQGIIVGTHICSLNLKGELVLKDSHGAHFLPKSS